MIYYIISTKPSDPHFHIFARMYLPLNLEVYNSPFFDSLGFMVVDEIRKTPPETQTRTLEIRFPSPFLIGES